jgi:hypothetical protein
MGIKWVDRDGANKIISAFANKQRDGQESLDEAHADIVAFYNPVLMDSERIDSAFPQSDVGRVIFEALFELVNRVIALEGGSVIDRSQLKTWLQNKLP